MPLLRTRRCLSCAHVYDVLDFGERGVLTIDADAGDACPKCSGAEWEGAVAVPTGIELGDEGGVGKIYPYYDHGLGCRVHSAKHRREICRRRGLVPVDGDFDHEQMMANHPVLKEREADEAAYAEYTDRLENAPEFRDYRELRDKGFYRE